VPTPESLEGSGAGHHAIGLPWQGVPTRHGNSCRVICPLTEC
jgi:hypothetical protein